MLLFVPAQMMIKIVDSDRCWASNKMSRMWIS